MVGFGQKIAEQLHPPWAASYLDYARLKQQIESILTAKNDPAAERVFDARKAIFQGTFDAEIVKVLRFYAERRDQALGEVAALQAEADKVPADIMDSEELLPAEKLRRIDELTKRLQGLARDVQRLLAFVGLNMQGMRKILKKFAKNVDPTPPTPGYLTLEIHHPHDPGWKLLQGTYLSPEVQQDLDSMILHKRIAQAAGTIRELSAQLAGYRKTVATASSPDLTAEETRGHLVRMDTLLRDLGAAERDAERNAGFISGYSWAARAGIFEEAPKDEYAVATMTGLLLNCANSALYMANYNLIVPNIRSFLLHVGASPTLAGIVIGCCDLASMPSTIAYSKWTNSNFRTPLLFSAASCLIGNLVLCVSYDARLLPLLFVARLVTGVGAARCVSRRYIAEYVAKRHRTKASAAFVGSSALGMAMGPLLAKAFQSFPTLHWGRMTFDPITMGAWSMTACWAAFVVATYFLFEDPLKAKSALRELEQPLLSAAENGEGAQAEHGEGVAADGTAAAGSSSGEEAASSKRVPLMRSESFRAALGPTMVCVYALLVLKTAQQAFLDSLPLFTSTAFGWSDGANGLYVGVLCLAMLPVTFIIGAISARVSDRILTAFSLALTLLGCGQLFFGAFPRWNFFVGGVWILIGTIIMEGAAMSLESKVIHPSFAEGTFNAGLLSTEAGTLGRFTGNLLLSVSSSFTGLKTMKEVANFARVLWSLVAVVVFSNLAWFAALYRRIKE